MLLSLSIKNFALIEKLSIDFSKGFSIITGETGAGKSILLGALGLVLGKRADLTSLKDKEEKCVIEAQFDVSKYNLKSFFEANDLDYENQTIIRREILPSGKSRAFINDSPVNLSALQELGLFLIDIHSQHQTQELSNENIQFQIIDAIAGNLEFVQEYALLLKSYKQEKNKLSALFESLKEAKKEQDYNAFLLEELLAAKLIPGQQEELESIFEQLSNVEFINEQLDKSLAVANEEQFGVLQNLKEIKLALQKIASMSSDYNLLFQRTNSVIIEFDDIVSEIDMLSEKLVNDPEKLDLINQQLQVLYSLQKKHHVDTIDELLVIQNDLENKVISVDALENDIKLIETTIELKMAELNSKAIKIRENRLKAVPVLSEKLIYFLEQLGMPNARFKIEVSEIQQFSSNGKDEIQFLFSANKGSDFGLLKKVASGGEMSRIMLAVKAILAQYSKLPTIIFDEIDTGVSGEIANKMSEIMRKMSENMQVFAITHLPQIAAKGNEHFKVFKTTIGNQTLSELKLLTSEERVVEIAEMLSGKDISDSAINHAKALLN
ncbi:DNA repair protein RecN [Flavobacterium soli]|uniref:DNA repair protein RecN n=1 Tax=Flavobacterium soli TaxID=344881 RepID=UPI0004094044|nr:DNA repair protein RecN [Flavobacterium soli]